MRFTQFAARIVVLMAAVNATSALAHHSAAMFDRDRSLTVRGTVKDWSFTNPHCWLYVAAPDLSGKLTQWGFEAGSPSTLLRMGITKNSVAAGMPVVVTMHPLKDGRPGGSLLSVTRPDRGILHFGLDAPPGSTGHPHFQPSN